MFCGRKASGKYARVQPLRRRIASAADSVGAPRRPGRLGSVHDVARPHPTPTDRTQRLSQPTSPALRERSIDRHPAANLNLDHASFVSGWRYVPSRSSKASRLVTDSFELSTNIAKPPRGTWAFPSVVDLHRRAATTPFLCDLSACMSLRPLTDRRSHRRVLGCDSDRSVWVAPRISRGREQLTSAPASSSTAIACAVGLFVCLCVGGFVWNRVHPPTAEQQARMEALRQSQAVGGFAPSYYPSTYLLRSTGPLTGYRRGASKEVDFGPKPVMWEVRQQEHGAGLRPRLEAWQVRPLRLRDPVRATSDRSAPLLCSQSRSSH